MRDIRKPPSGQADSKKLDQIVAKARKGVDARMAGYREQSLRLHPHVCGRCGREFTREGREIRCQEPFLPLYKLTSISRHRTI